MLFCNWLLFSFFSGKSTDSETFRPWEWRSLWAKCSRVLYPKPSNKRPNYSTAKKRVILASISISFSSADSSSSAIVAPFASAGIRPVVNRLNQDTTFYYGLVFRSFSWPYMVAWHNSGIIMISMFILIAPWGKKVELIGWPLFHISNVGKRDWGDLLPNKKIKKTLIPRLLNYVQEHARPLTGCPSLLCEAKFAEEAGLPSVFSTVVCRGENVLARSASLCLGFWKTNCRLALVEVAGLLSLWDEMKQGHIGLDLAFDLWLLGHFKLRIFGLSHGASRTGLWSLVLSLTVETRG